MKGENMLVYLDNSATTRPLDRVLDRIYTVSADLYGNPSSLHRMGVQAEQIMKDARKTVARPIGARPEEIFFTSGGTESDNTAIFGAAAARRRQGKRIITTQIEHPAVLECFQQLEQEGMDVVRLPAGPDGRVRIDDVRNALTGDTILVSVMHVNNETGAVQPIREIGELIRKQGLALFHCDAVQSYGKLPIDVKECHIDLLSASAHKIHGPKGIGLLYKRTGVHIPSRLLGGGQEHGFRSGTENVPAAAGFAEAAREAYDHLQEHLVKTEQMSRKLMEGICEHIPDVQINGPQASGNGDTSSWLPYIVNVSFEGTRGEVLLHMLEEEEIYVSTGSACSSHKKGNSHVLEAMGRKESETEGALRFSFSSENTPEQVDYTLEKLYQAVERHRKMMRIAQRMGR